MHTTRITLCSTAYELDTPSGTVKRAFDPVIIGAAYVRGVQQGPHSRRAVRGPLRDRFTAYGRRTRLNLPGARLPLA